MIIDYFQSEDRLLMIAVAAVFRFMMQGLTKMLSVFPKEGSWGRGIIVLEVACSDCDPPQRPRY